MAPPGQANVGKIYVKPWCNECKRHHTGNYSRCIRVRCYQCGKIGHYTCHYLRRVLVEQLLLESGASYFMRESRPPNPNRVQNEASVDVRPSQKGPIAHGASIAGSAQQTRRFAANEQGRNKYV